jgi:DNA-binding PadR family transcriptional regulator
MSLEYGILGYLSMKPMSGYDIKRLFDMSAAYFWPADQAQIYRALKKLVKEDCVELKESRSGITVDKKVYEITEKGEENLMKWISSPTESDYISRLPFIMRLFFSGTLSREEQLAFIDKQLLQNENVLSMLRRNYEKNAEAFARTVELPEGDRRMDSATYAHRWGILRGEAYSKLLKEIKEEL